MNRLPERLSALERDIVLDPMKVCHEEDFPPIGYAGGLFPRLMRDLHDHWPDLVLRYDRSTCRSAYEPGHHVYRRTNGGALVKVFSCQYDPDRIWPLGGPREPGPWLIPALQKKFAPKPTLLEEHDQRQAAYDRTMNNAHREFGKDLAAYSESAGANRNGLGTKLRRNLGRRRSAPVKVWVNRT